VPSNRGANVLFAGLAMWGVGRLFGSPGLEVVGVGILALPIASSLLAHRRHLRLVARRRLSEVRVAPGTRVSVSIDLENRSPVATPFLLAEDRVAASLGRPARMVIPGIPPGSVRRISYTLVPRSRGRYNLGPLTVDVSDPFALTRRRIRFEELEELLVSPEIEDLSGPADAAAAPNFGTSRARKLFRTGQEFYTMRPYQQGDDLRRLHWPSVARTGELMIRQDESSRRASGLVLLDNRRSSLGQAHQPAFERAVSVAATLGVLLLRGGFSVRLATAETQPMTLTEDRFLEALTSISHSGKPTFGRALERLRSEASAETTLVVVSSPLTAAQLAPLIRAAGGFGPKLAVFVHPVEPASLPVDRQAQLEGAATEARISVVRAGWDCVVLTPSMRLKDRWNALRERPLARSG
jgi:uncharacterized protein (DUF58 family)